VRKDLKELKQITAPILEDIKVFEQEFRDALKSEVRLVNTIGKYILRHKGKHIRPILTILASRVCGEKPSLNSYRAAVMIELLHVATLVHDDVVDDAEKRRGFPSINRAWKNKVAVLMGDFLMSKALINIVGIKDFEALMLISSTAEKMSAGEIFQIEKTITRTISETDYYNMIFQKTASLISASCELGAITVTGKEKDREAMRTYGAKLGMAFQIRDDLFDLFGKEEDIGKNVGADVKRNLMTLPVIHSYKTLSKPAAKEVKKLLNGSKKSRKNIGRLRDIVDAAGGQEYARNKMDEFGNQALDAIAEYPDSPYKQSMTELIAFNSQRIR
jgi:octaprenyl-diphosphate synthase